MKNTKHTEMNDSSNDQEITSQSKRKVLTSLGITSGVIGASALSQNWVKPVVNSVVLPAHAQTSPGTGTPTTTMAPTTTMTQPGILISTDSDGTIGDGGTGDAGSVTYQVRLATLPTNTVTVEVTVDPATAATAATDPTTDPVALSFDLNQWDQWKPVVVTAAATDVTERTDVTVTFEASGGGYNELMAERTFTIINDDPEPVTEVEAVASNYSFTDDNGDVTVTWTAPATDAEILGYVVSSDQVETDGSHSQRLGPDVTTAVFIGIPAGDHVFTVTVNFKEGTNPAGVPAASVTVGP